jgi:hypothetical protein
MSDMADVTRASLQRCGAILLCSVLLGCGGGDTPPLGQVTGTVTLDGKPIDGAMLQFEPVSSGLPTAFGKTDKDGKYELWYSRGNKGASLGESLVRIQAFQDANPDEGTKRRPEIIPAKYNVMTDLKVEVTRGAQSHNFELKSGGEIIQPDVEMSGRSAVTGCW